MKIRHVCVLGMLLCLLGMTGCEASEESKSQNYEYTHINTMFGHIYKEGMPIGDWGYGLKNSDSHGDRFDAESPIFSIHVHPFANEELIDLYVDDLMVIDRHMAQNNEYLKYARKNHPYYVSFDCLGQEILIVPIDGKADYKAVREDLTNALVPCTKEARQKLDGFENYIHSYKDIQTDENGDYYFLIDSRNVSDSIEPVRNCIDEIRAAYPFSEEEMSGLYAANEYVGMLGGGYSIYFDSYGNDPLFVGFELDFATPSRVLFNSVYAHFVPTGTLDEGPVRTFYYCTMEEDENEAFGGYETTQTMTPEEVNELLWKIYDAVETEHEEHGIKAISDMRFGGDCLLTGDPQNLGYETKVTIPIDMLDERITREEFVKLVEASSQTYDPADRQIPDDY